MRRKVLIAAGTLLVLLAAGLWIAYQQGILPGYVQLRTYTDDASGLMDGTKVRLNGIPIGYLDHQRLTGLRDHSRAVEFDMKVRPAYLSKIPVDSTVRVVADNLLSDKAINILPGFSSQTVTPGAELVSANSLDPNKMMAQMSNTLAQFQRVMDRASGLLVGVDNGAGNVGKMKADWSTQWNVIPLEMQKLMTDYRNAKGTANKLLVDNSELTAQFQTTQKRIDDIMGSFQAGEGSAAKLSHAGKDFEPIQREIDALNAAIQSRKGNVNDLQGRLDNLMARFSGLMEKVNAGQGSLGQFLVNPQLSQAMAGTGREFQTLAKDLRVNPRKFFTLRVAVF